MPEHSAVGPDGAGGAGSKPGSVSNEVTIRRLLAALARREEAAMRDLHAMMGRRIIAFALNRLGDQDRAETVMVDTLMEVWNHPERFRFESQFSTWVLGIARYKVLTHLRQSARVHDDIADHEDVIADPEPGAPERIASSQQASHLRDCLEGLVAAQRESLHLVYFEEMSIQEVAEIQGVPTGTVKTRVFHGRRNMKVCLEGRIGGLL